MTQSTQTPSGPGIVQGEFFTDGSTFVLRLKDSPLAGTGKSAQDAFDDLIRVRGGVGDFAEKLELLARDQQGEQVRATLIRVVATWLIALTVVGGLAAGMAAVSPKLAADFAAVNARLMGGESMAPSRGYGDAPTDTP